MKTNPRIKYFWKAWVWAGLIIAGSLVSGPSIPKFNHSLFGHVDKLIHFFMYFILTLFLLSGFHKMPPRHQLYLKQKIYGLILSVLFGGLLELFQIVLTTQRTGDVYDFVANVTGSVIGVTVFRMTRKIIPGFL